MSCRVNKNLMMIRKKTKVKKLYCSASMLWNKIKTLKLKVLALKHSRWLSLKFETCFLSTTIKSRSWSRVYKRILFLLTLYLEKMNRQSSLKIIMRSFLCKFKHKKQFLWRWAKRNLINCFLMKSKKIKILLKRINLVRLLF